MFRRVLSGKAVVVIVVYVKASATKCDQELALKDLHSCFPVNDLGETPFFHKCLILRDRDAGTLKLDQHQYVQALAERFEITRTRSILFAAGGKPLSKVDEPQTPSESPMGVRRGRVQHYRHG